VAVGIVDGSVVWALVGRFVGGSKIVGSPLMVGVEVGIVDGSADGAAVGLLVGTVVGEDEVVGADVLGVEVGDFVGFLSWQGRRSSSRIGRWTRGWTFCGFLGWSIGGCRSYRNCRSVCG